MLGTGGLPEDIIRDFSDRFSVTREEGGELSLELRPGRGLYAFLEHLASGMDPAPNLERLALLGLAGTERCMDCTHSYPSSFVVILHNGVY